MLLGLVGHGLDALLCLMGDVRDLQLSSLFGLLHVLLNFPEGLVVFGFPS